jgi:tripartite-type tricarboxylate transporter receptor subunit TctC
VVSPKIEVSSIAQLIEKAKAQKLSYGSPGVGSRLHLAVELLKVNTGIDILPRPLRRVPESTERSSRRSNRSPGDQLAGSPERDQRQAGPLAMTASRRNWLVPDVPTLAEAGVEGIDATSWYGLQAPRAIPNGVRNALFMVTREILDNPRPARRTA